MFVLSVCPQTRDASPNFCSHPEVLFELDVYPKFIYVSRVQVHPTASMWLVASAHTLFKDQ